MRKSESFLQKRRLKHRNAQNKLYKSLTLSGWRGILVIETNNNKTHLVMFTSKKLYSGAYRVNEIKEEVLIERSEDNPNLWTVSCWDLSDTFSSVKFGSKKECLQYLHSIVYECENWAQFTIK